MQVAACFSPLHRSKAWLIGLPLLLLSSCQPSGVPPGSAWQVYHNPRYGFEFPYPSQWIAANPPDNRDGRAFYDPKNPAAEIRGWASYNVEAQLSPSQSATLPRLRPNFKTRQGVSGELKVDVGTETSSMTLVVEQGGIRYYWQGRSPQQQFDDYYRLFYYIVSQYRIQPESVPSSDRPL